MWKERVNIITAANSKNLENLINKFIEEHEKEVKFEIKHISLITHGNAMIHYKFWDTTYPPTYNTKQTI